MSLQETACSCPDNPSVRKKGEVGLERVSVCSTVDVETKTRRVAAAEYNYY
jgi:hypothetical protein